MMFLSRARLLGAVVIATVLLAGCAANIKSPTGMTTTLILLRHAERTQNSLELNDKGRARAAALPVALDGVHIDAIYSPNLSRNLDTVAALAKQRSLTVKVMEVAWFGNAARLIRENAGNTVLWVGNTNNLPGIYEDIGGKGRPPISYGDLYIARVPDKGSSQVTKSHFGR